MKYLKILFLFQAIILLSCGQQFKEIIPQSNENNIKIKLELVTEKSLLDPKGAFAIRLTNTGERDLGRCNLKFDNKFEHQLEGLINKSDDWEGKIKHSMLKVSESVTIVFSHDIDNYTTFGIRDENFSIPEIIELNCLDGKVIWKTK